MKTLNAPTSKLAHARQITNKNGSDMNVEADKAPIYDLVLICPQLGAGGTQRVVTTLANAWQRCGRQVCLITLFGEEAYYALEEGIHHCNMHHTYLYPQQRVNDQPVGDREIARASALRIPILRLREWLWEIIATWRVTKVIGRYYYFLRLIFYLRRTLQRLGASSIAAFCGSTNVIALFASAGLNMRVVISERNDPGRQRLDAPWQLLRPYFYNRADVVTANTQNALTVMQHYVDRAKLVYIPNPLIFDDWGSTNKRPVETANLRKSPLGPSSPRAHQTAAAMMTTGDRKATTNRTAFLQVSAPQSLAPKPSILTVGRLHEQKAHDVLLKAFQRLPNALSHWQLTVVGDGHLEDELSALANTLGIAARVHWTGWVQDPHPYYQSAQIFVLPSRYEGMSNSLLEAMSCGLPVIVTGACGGLLEIVAHGKNGFVVPVDDPDALAASIAQLASDQLLRERLGNAAIESLTGFALPHILQQWESVLEI